MTWRPGGIDKQPLVRAVHVAMLTGTIVAMAVRGQAMTTESHAARQARCTAYFLIVANCVEMRPRVSAASRNLAHSYRASAEELIKQALLSGPVMLVMPNQQGPVDTLLASSDGCAGLSDLVSRESSSCSEFIK